MVDGIFYDVPEGEPEFSNRNFFIRGLREATFGQLLDWGFG